MIPISTQQKLEKAQKNGKTIVLATGVFDLLHGEHKNFLKKAKKAGDFLIVGIESDVRVRYIKGKGRPIESQKKRMKKIAEIHEVDEVFILPEEFNNPSEHMTLIKKIMPSILAVSANTPKLERKKELMKSIGGKVIVVHEHNPEVSTTRIIGKLVI